MNDLVESFSGVRGIYGKSLNENLAEAYAYSFWKLLAGTGKNPIKIVIGRDTRPSGLGLSSAFIKTLIPFGVKIIDLGVSSTPATEHAVRFFKAQGGIMITASHNPPEYNGWKLLGGKSSVLEAKDIAKVIFWRKGKTAKTKKGIRSIPQTVGNKNIKNYVNFVKGVLGPAKVSLLRKKKIKILFDAGGGAVISFIDPLVAELGIKAEKTNNISGVFDRQIEPTGKSLSHLPALLKKTKADFAIGFDADADRGEIVLGSGEMLSGQYTLALLTEAVLSAAANPQKQIVVVNDATSDLIHAVAAKYGANVLEVETGEINVVNGMDDNNSLVGGEGSNGGVIISPSRCRDGLLAAAVLASHIAKTGKSLESIVNSYPRFYNLNEKVVIKNGSYSRAKLENKFSKDPSADIFKTGDETGGLKIRFLEGGWLWFRQSKTEPNVVRVYAESKSKMKAEKLLKQGVKMVK